MRRLVIALCLVGCTPEAKYIEPAAEGAKAGPSIVSSLFPGEDVKVGGSTVTVTGSCGVQEFGMRVYNVRDRLAAGGITQAICRPKHGDGVRQVQVNVDPRGPMTATGVSSEGRTMVKLNY